METLVIVESPTKARTIEKYLPKSYSVVASMGHIRDLPRSASEIPESVKKQKWAQIGVNCDNNFEPIYVIPSDKKKVVADLKKRLKTAKTLILATDVDREGESISWHLKEVLSPKMPVNRMVFHEITKTAINKSLNEMREINLNLVQAQETRRILDRLVGYTLSPLLWKKIAIGLSAGRVQSVAVLQIVLRERERIRFIKADYWDLKAAFTKQNQSFEADLIKVKDKRVANGKSFDETTGKLKANKEDVVLDGKRCAEIVEKILSQPFTITDIESKSIEKKPPPPFTTSTLQQESGRKLGLSSKDTMRVAQSLYENGLITYMRTDSVNLSEDAVTKMRKIIHKEYGKEYLVSVIRQFENKAKNVQEAHEAIRPADSFANPKSTNLSGRELAMYDMIWKRTIATQMTPAKLTYISAFLDNDGYIFRASGKKIDFPGYFKLYIEGYDDNRRDDEEAFLPDLKKGERLKAVDIKPIKHTTQPRSRFTEAALINLLEKEGIGRPSTYASVISTIIDRKYARKNHNTLVPSFTAFAVSHLLEDNFKEFVDISFTAHMETILDDIANGKADYKKYLDKFYNGENGLYAKYQGKNESISPTMYRDIHLPNLKPKIMLGKYGPYVEIDTEDGAVRVSIPEEIDPGNITEDAILELAARKKAGNNMIGTDPKTKENIYLLTGRFGPFVQLGEVTNDGPKPKRSPLPKNMQMQEVTLETAIMLLSLPSVVGQHPDGGEITLAIGRFGPFIQHLLPDNSKNFRSVKEDELMTMNLTRALELLSQEKKSKRSNRLKVIGTHPESREDVNLCDGTYGKYIKFSGNNYSIDKRNYDPENITLEQALTIISNKPAGKKKTTFNKRITKKNTRKAK